MAGIGSRRRGRRGGGLQQNVEINVTSLVDLAFTLLVIFMITAPMMQGGIEVDVPQADVRALDSDEDAFYISVTRDNRIYMEETEVTLEELESGLPQLLSAGTVETVYIRADSMARYGPFVRVVATLVNSGMDFAMVSEPWTGEP